ncbi:unnamed protein product [Urochloa decumbens]|uniref:No apical meristem-associated C-terminal domain-containing protein n=1 Tax=Urochloa decumbens TaxID=240449 RepID=A0ABC9HGE7_9POAL
MAGSAPLGDGGPAWGTDKDEPSRTRPPPRLAGPPLPCGISGDGRPPRPAAPTSTSKKRRSTFVAPTRPAARRPDGDLPRQDLGATPCQVPDGVWPRQVPDHALAPGAFVPRQLFEAPPPVARLPSPLRHERRQEGASHAGSVFTGASRKGQAPSYSEPAQLPSHQVQKRPMEAAATASDTRRTASTTSMQDDGNYLSSSSVPFYDWSPTPTADYTMQDPMGSSSLSYVAMLTQENSEADLEILTQAPVTDIGSSRGRGGNYNHTEDIQLCWSWMAITFDPRIGNDQPKSTYWNRIAQHYHDNKTFDSIRNANSLEKRWNTIQRECIRFQGCFDKIERLRPSGVPQTEYINLAQKSFDETKGFPYIHCWMEVRHTQKFQSVYEAMKQATQGSRQSRHSKSTAPSQEAQEEDRAPSERPPGRKKSKQKLKRNDGEDEYAVQLATLIQMKAEEQKKRDERWRADKELEERKLLWDQEQKIMFCNTSDMDESQRVYVMAMRQKIVADKEALVKASGGGSTSEQASSTNNCV